MKQKIILLLGLAAFIAAALFPNWICRYSGGAQGDFVKSIGRSFLLTTGRGKPPTLKDSQSLYSWAVFFLFAEHCSSMSMFSALPPPPRNAYYRIDFATLFTEWFFIAVVTGTVLMVLRGKEPKRE
jgi:hypothetical protein